MTPLAPRATVVERDGRTYVHAVCRECEKPITLSCMDENGEVIVPNLKALQWADMLVCDECAGRLEQAREARESTREVTQRIREAGIPESFRGLRFEDMHAKTVEREKAIAAAWAWADADPREGAGVLLWGNPGTGKTRLAATATWHRLQSRPVTWCSVAHLIASLQAAFSDEDRKSALRILTGKGALVLDDLDKVSPSQSVLSQLFVAVDRRVAAGAPLFVTSNAEPSRLVERFGGAIMSRLLGYCGVFRFDGPDYRLRRSERGDCE